MYIPSHLNLTKTEENTFYVQGSNFEVKNYGTDLSKQLRSIMPYVRPNSCSEEVVANEPVEGWLFSMEVYEDSRVKITHPVHGFSVLINVECFLRYAYSGWERRKLMVCYRDTPSGVALSVCSEEESMSQQNWAADLLVVADATDKLVQGDIVSFHFSEASEKFIFITALDDCMYLIAKSTGTIFKVKQSYLFIRHGLIPEESTGALKVLERVIIRKHANMLPEQIAGLTTLSTLQDDVSDDLDITPTSVKSWLTLCDSLEVDISRSSCLKFWSDNELVRVSERIQQLKLVKVKGGYQVKCTRNTAMYTGQKGTTLPYDEAALLFLNVLYNLRVTWSGTIRVGEHFKKFCYVQDFETYTGKCEIELKRNTY